MSLPQTFRPAAGGDKTDQKCVSMLEMLQHKPLLTLSRPGCVVPSDGTWYLLPSFCAFKKLLVLIELLYRFNRVATFQRR